MRIKRSPEGCRAYWWELDIQWKRLRHYWTCWNNIFPIEIVQAMNDRGISSIDIRDWRRRYDCDIIVVRLWNYRKFEFTGLEIQEYKYGYGRIRITG